MKTINGNEFAFHLGDEFVIFELGDGVDDLSRGLLERSVEILIEEYDRPFGVVFPRSNRVAIDLLAARELFESRVQNLVGIANVTADPSTLMSVEYEKTVIDQIPIETFSAMSPAVSWITELVRKKRAECVSVQAKATPGRSV